MISNEKSYCWEYWKGTAIIGGLLSIAVVLTIMTAPETQIGWDAGTSTVWQIAQRSH